MVIAPTFPSASANASGVVAEGVHASARAAIDASPGPSASQRAKLAAEAEHLQLQLLQTMGSPSAIQGALNASDVPPSDLSGGPTQPLGGVRGKDAGH
jgi:hypothetical protein